MSRFDLSPNPNLPPLERELQGRLLKLIDEFATIAARDMSLIGFGPPDWKFDSTWSEALSVAFTHEISEGNWKTTKTEPPPAQDDTDAEDNLPWDRHHPLAGAFPADPSVRVHVFNDPGGPMDGPDRPMIQILIEPSGARTRIEAPPPRNHAPAAIQIPVMEEGREAKGEPWDMIAERPIPRFGARVYRLHRVIAADHWGPTEVEYR